MQMVSCPFLQPATDQSRLMGAVVVQHEADVEIGGNSSIYLLQKIQELNRMMASIALAKDVAGGDAGRKLFGSDNPLIAAGWVSGSTLVSP